MKSYQNLLKTILQDGHDHPDRTGAGRKSIFGYEFIHDMKDGFPLLTTKRMYWKGIATELCWFLKGDTHIKYLVDRGCDIWVGDAYKAFKNRQENKDTKITREDFIERIKYGGMFSIFNGNLGPIYGKQWRKWRSHTHEPTGEIIGGKEICKDKEIDQIQNLINTLKADPYSARHLVNAWNVGEIHEMIVPPCHYAFQCYVRGMTPDERYNYWFDHNYETGMERGLTVPDYDDPYYEPTPKYYLSLKWSQRSVDTFLGLPFNIASYAMLLTALANEVGMVPDKLIGSLGDTHIYLNHLEQVNEQLTRKPYPLPQFEIEKKSINDLEPEDFRITNYRYHDSIKAQLNNS